MNILIADDDALQRELLQGFLEKHGYRVFSAGDGAEAVQLFRREPVQLALLDHRMPGLTGDQVLAEMKAINPLVRAILITADPLSRTRAKLEHVVLLTDAGIERECGSTNRVSGRRKCRTPRRGGSIR